MFWIRVFKDTFRIAFWFGDKAESIIEQSDLTDSIKNDFKKAKKMGTMGRCIFIDIADSNDLDTVFKLIEINYEKKNLIFLLSDNGRFIDVFDNIRNQGTELHN
nr:DUF3788 family protein [Bacteroidota bacterium]